MRNFEQVCRIKTQSGLKNIAAELNVDLTLVELKSTTDLSKFAEKIARSDADKNGTGKRAEQKQL